MNELPQFIIDVCLGQHVIYDYLKNLGWNVLRHKDCFEENAADDSWFLEAGKNNWAVLSADGKMKFRPNEKLAIINGNIKMFVLKSKQQNSEQFNYCLQKHEKTIVALSKFMSPPFIAKITKGHIGFEWLGNID